MTVNDLISKYGYEVLNLSDGDREITGYYTGDLLSWVMGRAGQGNVWVTIMTNINVVAVAFMADVSCVIIAENAEIEQGVIDTAASKNVNILRTPKGAFDVCHEQVLL